MMPARPFGSAAGGAAGVASSFSGNCDRWRRVAARLGETFAGLRLRRTIVARSCAFSDLMPAEESVWSWPWGAGELRMELPPRLHGSYGAWTIRCGQSGRRERCALIHETTASISPGDGAADQVGVVTHFVIDEVGGEERLLWRVFVERAEPSWFLGKASSHPAATGTDFVRARAGAVMMHKSFDDCSRAGCLMEARIGVGPRIAARLSAGGNLRLDVRPRAGLLLSRSVSPSGFREGMAELLRLKRHERSTVAGN